MTVKEYHLYPDYRITEENKVHELRQLKKERHAVINKALMSKEFELMTEKRYFVFLLMRFMKKFTRLVSSEVCLKGYTRQKIEDLVKEGITDVQEVKSTLCFFVKTDMRENLPSENNQAYYPTTTDIQNHSDAAKPAIQLSKFDQISMKTLYEEWTNSAKPGKYFSAHT